MRAPARTLLPFLLAMAAVAASAGCGGAGSSSPTVVINPPLGPLPCPALALNGPALVSPAPGSTGVPASLSVLTFGPLPIPDIISAAATLSGSDGSTITSGPLTFISSPTSLGTYTASIAGLQPHTTYTVKVTGTINERGCINAVLGNDGSFTTQ